MFITRRRFLGLIPPALGALFLAACGGDSGDDAEPTTGSGGSGETASPTEAPAATSSAGGGSTTAQLEPTPACGDDDEPRIEQTEGPYFTPDSPERTSFLEDGVTGTTLLVSGLVVSTSCEPVENALVDFWHCDAEGVYDNEGYTLRGHQFTDASGAYRLETILPGVYTGRTRPPGQPVLTTQLYFPNEPENARDGIFDESLLMAMGKDGDTQTGSFRFVLDV